ncbi:MAG: 3-hydroxyacyl-ACP dehydratase FabZ [Gammaproteobacteria bacterium]|nr:3-hydroxyacyl-ACP dehydratase FabZ [Gammaproteobacteria bacterium]
MSDSSVDFNIRDYIPHRYPFLLVDRILDVNIEAKSIRGLKNVTQNEPFFQGHFPTRPILPGVLIVEALAQVSGILAMRVRDLVLKDIGVMFVLAGTDRTRFKKPVVPGDSLLLDAKVVSERREIVKFECEALVEDTVVCSTELMIAHS